MKIFFYLLATVNIAFFMWEVKQGALTKPPVPNEISKAVTSEPIVLVSELSKDDSSLASDNRDKGASIRCYLAGPFSNQSSYRKWLNKLKIDPKNVAVSSKDDLTIDGYIVFYPAADTMEKAQENIKMLKVHGVKDLWLFDSGEQKGEIALGSFNDEDRAMLMKNEMLAKGIAAEVKPKFKSKIQHYIGLKGDQKLLETIQDLKASFPQVEVEIVDQCNGI
jgi:hypothetical protein